MEALTRCVLVGLAVLNVAMTVWHWRIVRRGWRYQAETQRRHDEAERLLAAVGMLVHATYDVRITSNGHRAHEEGPQP